MKNLTDLSFITNEEGQSLLNRFKVLIRDTEAFDVLVGYFYSSGFHALYKSLEKTKQIRILIGIGTDKKTAGWIQSSEEQQEFLFSHQETKVRFSKKLVQEMDASKDTAEVHAGVMKFMEWLRSGKLQIKAYPSQNLHAKLYIMSFAEEDRDRGRIITGSSNFTQAGLTDNMEFNVELKNPSDYEFALQKFNELWSDAVEVKEDYLKTIQEKTWLNDKITPYELYLKFLYEHFKEDLKLADESPELYIPQNFKRLEYQTQAVQNAKRIVLEYGGVFLSDVVGLGKTYMSAMLAKRLGGRSLVLAPPLLLEKSNPGSWPNVFSDFHTPAVFESLGKLDKVISQGTGKYENIFIDEAHRFRHETNITYEKLSQICRGKRLILVTATPLNNSPQDILSQIKLFQPAKKSSIPNIPNLERFFGDLHRKIKKLNKAENPEEYLQVTKDNAKQIRESVLKYLMVRRTRTEIENYFAEDLQKQSVTFPEVKDPKPVYYQFNQQESQVFQKTVELIGKQLKYARYMPLIYHKKPEQLDLDIQSQKNLGVFMKVLLVKRLESSFHAFQNSIRRFIQSYEQFLKEFDRGNIYVSKDYSNKIFDLLDNDDEVAIQKLIDEDKATRYKAEDFTEDLKGDLNSDLSILYKIKSLWTEINRDPKLSAFIEALSKPKALIPINQNKSMESGLKTAEHLNKFSALKDKQNKLIVFTESKETAEYLGQELNKKFPDEVLVFTGSSAARIRDDILENFDPKAFNPKNDYRILIATEVLSEGVNLHRSNVVINYDLPWNPTRMMQRVGRINRVDTNFQQIHTFNFFPTEQSNEVIKLEQTAKAKIAAFINLLGTDARLLTGEEIPTSHELFGRLNSKKTITGEREEGESELKYLKIIKDIRDTNPDLFNKIKHLPKKARTARKYNKQDPLLISGLDHSPSDKGTESSLPDKETGSFPPDKGTESSPPDKETGSFPPDKGGKESNRGGSSSDKGTEEILKQQLALSSPLSKSNHLLTYFRKGKLNKFCLTRGGGESLELDFLSSAKLLEAQESTLREAFRSDFFTLLKQNKAKFNSLTLEDEQPFAPYRSGKDQSSELLKTLKVIEKDLRQFTEEQEAYFRQVINRLKEGALPKQTVKTALKALKKEIQASSGTPKPLKILALLELNIPRQLLQSHISENSAVLDTDSPSEVILSEYLIGE